MTTESETRGKCPRCGFNERTHIKGWSEDYPDGYHRNHFEWNDYRCDGCDMRYTE